MMPGLPARGSLYNTGLGRHSQPPAPSPPASAPSANPERRSVLATPPPYTHTHTGHTRPPASGKGHSLLPPARSTYQPRTLQDHNLTVASGGAPVGGGYHLPASRQCAWGWHLQEGPAGSGMCGIEPLPQVNHSRGWILGTEAQPSVDPSLWEGLGETWAAATWLRTACPCPLPRHPLRAHQSWLSSPCQEGSPHILPGPEPFLKPSGAPGAGTETAGMSKRNSAQDGVCRTQD